MLEAYRLESIRKGSRIFIDPAIPDDEFGEHKGMFLRWKQITARGPYVPNVGEFLWPAMAYSESNRLAEVTLILHGWWSGALRKKQWPKDIYSERMLHLDETVKLFIRTASMFCTEECRRKLLFSMLPKTDGDHKNINYEWGMWFQAMKGLVEHCEQDLSKRIVEAFGIMREKLSKAGYFQHFTQELNYPDYADFKEKLIALGLHRPT